MARPVQNAILRRHCNVRICALREQKNRGRRTVGQLGLGQNLSGCLISAVIGVNVHLALIRRLNRRSYWLEGERPGRTGVTKYLVYSAQDHPVTNGANPAEAEGGGWREGTSLYSVDKQHNCAGGWMEVDMDLNVKLLCSRINP